MQLRKDILLFYLLIIVSLGVIIAADKPVEKTRPNKVGAKCCTLPGPIRSSMPLNTITEGIFRIKV